MEMACQLVMHLEWHGGPVYINNKDADTVDIDYSRAAMKWTPSDKFEATVIYESEGEYGGRRQTTSGPNGWGEYYDDYEIGAVINEPSSMNLNLQA